MTDQKVCDGCGSTIEPQEVYYELRKMGYFFGAHVPSTLGEFCNNCISTGLEKARARAQGS